MIRNVTYRVIRATDILSETEMESLSAGSDFSWGDTDVVLVRLDNFLEVCKKHNFYVAKEIRQMDTGNRSNGFKCDIYVSLTD